MTELREYQGVIDLSSWVDDMDQVVTTFKQGVNGILVAILIKFYEVLINKHHIKKKNIDPF